MKGYIANIEQLALENTHFRHVLYTGKFSQLVLMSLLPAEEIGEEVHDVDQFFRIETGSGTIMIDDVSETINDGSAIIVPAGARHNIINTGSEPMKLYSLYAPPHHKDGTAHATKGDSEAAHEHFDGITTE